MKKLNQINANLRQVGEIIKQKRKQISDLREELEDLNDYLDLLEARAQDNGKPTISHQEMKTRLGMK